MVQLRHICSPISAAAKARVAEALWAADPVAIFAPTNTEPYFEYYKERCKTAFLLVGSEVLFLTHDGIAQLGQDLKENLAREEVYRRLEERHPDLAGSNQSDKAAIVHGAINLAATLFLMADVGRPTENIWTRRTYRVWEQGSIRDFAASIFPEERSSLGRTKLPRDFNARNLYDIGGLTVELTNNLLDHLKLADEETKVIIFHHASFLRNQKCTVFPEGFVDETLQTLALLFPQRHEWHLPTKFWYQRHLVRDIKDADDGVLSVKATEETFNIDAYRYWGERLARLKEVYDDARPRTARQWWYDRREGTSWYALWVVLGFTVFFGLVQSIEGALQVYKAYNPGDGGGKGG